MGKRKARAAGQQQTGERLGYPLQEVLLFVCLAGLNSVDPPNRLGFNCVVVCVCCLSCLPC